MRVPIKHNLPKDEVRRRLRDNIGSLKDHMPGGTADVRSDWPSEDRMNLVVAAMGQQVTGTIEVEETQVVVDFNLPPALAFFEPIVAGAIRQSGPKLLSDK